MIRMYEYSELGSVVDSGGGGLWEHLPTLPLPCIFIEMVQVCIYQQQLFYCPPSYFQILDPKSRVAGMHSTENVYVADTGKQAFTAELRRSVSHRPMQGLVHT